MSQTKSKNVKLATRKSGKKDIPKNLAASKTPYGSNRGPYLHKTIHKPDVPSAKSELQKSASRQQAYGSHLTDGSFGVDKTRITVQMKPETIHDLSFVQKLLKPKRYGFPTKGLAAIENFPAIFIKWDGYNHRLELEFNPSDFTRDEGFELCPFEILPLTCDWVIRKVLATGDPQARPIFAKNELKRGRHDFNPGWESQVQVSRLDLARDFHITDPRFSEEQLAHIYPSRSRHQAATHFRNDGLLNTLSYPVSARTPHIKFYNKCEERKRKPIPNALPIKKGTYRFEVSYPRHALREMHRPTLDLMTPVALGKMIRSKWVASNYWINLIWEGSLVKLLLEKVGPIEAAEITFLIHCLGVGIKPEMPRAVLAARMRVIRALGLSTKLPIHKQGPFYGHLDFIAGSLAKPLPPGFSITKDDLFRNIEDRTI